MLTTLSMFSKVLVHAWSQCGGLEEVLNEGTFYIGSFEGNTQFWYAKRCKNEFGPQMNQHKMFFAQTSTPNMHQKTYQTCKVLYAKQPTPDQNSG